MIQERTDEDVVRRELARQQYALGGDDEPTAEALAALARLVARLKGSEELHKLRANAERMMIDERDRLLARLESAGQEGNILAGKLGIERKYQRDLTAQLDAAEKENERLRAERDGDQRRAASILEQPEGAE